MYDSQMHFCIVKIKEMSDELGRVPTSGEWKKKFPNINVTILFGSYDHFLRSAGIIDKATETVFKYREPKILVFDIETKPLKAYCWGLFDQNISTDMLIEDWSVMSWAAKWVGSDRMFYQDLSQNTDYTNDELIVRGIWELFNESDIIVGQNSDKFDIKKLNDKFEFYKLGLPSPYKSVDTLKIMRKHLGLTSKKLAFATDRYNTKYKKLKHEKFSGMSLWLECLKGNQEAWACMKEYNCYDVLATEELWIDHLRKWDKSFNTGVFTGTGGCTNCGSDELTEKNHNFTKAGAFKVFLCRRCGSYSSSKNNELSKSVKSKLLK